MNLLSMQCLGKSNDNYYAFPGVNLWNSSSLIRESLKGDDRTLVAACKRVVCVYSHSSIELSSIGSKAKRVPSHGSRPRAETYHRKFVLILSPFYRRCITQALSSALLHVLQTASKTGATLSGTGPLQVFFIRISDGSFPWMFATLSSQKSGARRPQLVFSDALPRFKSSTVSINHVPPDDIKKKLV